MNWPVVIIAVFLPLLLWTGSVISISMMGYPGVVCMTPVAWVLALPVGLRVHHQSPSPRTTMLREAALSGGLLGLWQGLLFAAVMAVSPYLPDYTSIDDLPNPYLVGALAVILSVPVTGGLAAGIAWLRARNKEQI